MFKKIIIIFLVIFLSSCLLYYRQILFDFIASDKVINADISYHKGSLESEIYSTREKYLSVKEEFDSHVTRLATLTNGKAIIPKDLKSINSIIQELQINNGDLSRVDDILSATIIYPNFSKLNDAINIILNDKEKYTIIKRDSFKYPLPSGYRDIKLSVKLSNESNAELQLNLPKIYEIKDSIGNNHYNHYMSILSNAKNEGRSLTTEEKNIISESNKITKELFDEAFILDGGNISK